MQFDQTIEFKGVPSNSFLIRITLQIVHKRKRKVTVFFINFPNCESFTMSNVHWLHIITLVATVECFLSQSWLIKYSIAAHIYTRGL